MIVVNFTCYARRAVVSIESCTSDERGGYKGVRRAHRGLDSWPVDGDACDPGLYCARSKLDILGSFLIFWLVLMGVFPVVVFI